MKKSFKTAVSIVCMLVILCGLFAGFEPAAEVLAKSVTSTGGTYEMTLNYTVLNGEATITYTVDSKEKIKSAKYVYDKCDSCYDSTWTYNANDFTGFDSFSVREPGYYTVRLENEYGNYAICSINVRLEFRAVWVAYSNFDNSHISDEDKQSEELFTEYIRKIFNNALDMGMNAVVVHVRPFSDAMYNSSCYPWSRYASGEQGKDPGYDPLEIMVREAHSRGLEFHAWLNPYRVCLYNTDPLKLDEKNPARIWLTDGDEATDRNVLSYGGNLYYNPSKYAVRQLIVNGVKEIVKNYDVDGIHFDDYFYPDLTQKNYKKNFDAQEYNEYKQECSRLGKSAMSLVKWRRNNVNVLVKAVYQAVKSIDPSVEFGISPGGYIDYLSDKHRWYVDYKTWLSKDGYIDYICPQLYWSFNRKNVYPFYDTLLRWIAARTNNSTKVYVGLPAYKMNEKLKLTISDIKGYDAEFYNPFLLSDMVIRSRQTGQVDGFIFFDYQNLAAAKNKDVVEYLKETW